MFLLYASATTVKIGACVVQNDRKLFSFGLLSHMLLPIGNRQQMSRYGEYTVKSGVCDVQTIRELSPFGLLAYTPFHVLGSLLTIIYRCQYCPLHLSTTSPHGDDIGTSGNHAPCTCGAIQQQCHTQAQAATPQQDQATIYLQNQSRITTTTQSTNYTKSKPQTHK